jgi:Monoamine oxidase
VANGIAADLGPALSLQTPARSITHDDDGVRVDAGDVSVRAKHAIVAVPPALAAQLQYRPSARRPRRPNFSTACPPARS